MTGWLAREGSIESQPPGAKTPEVALIAWVPTGWASHAARVTGTAAQRYSSRKNRLALSSKRFPASM